MSVKMDKILVVDDDEDIGEIYSFQLTAEDAFLVDYSPDGVTVAGRPIEDYDQYFGIVMDYRLQGRVGTDVIAQIRGRGYKGIIVLNTGFMDVVTVAGADAVMQKPGYENELLIYFDSFRSRAS